jgi:hypothetical protein
VVRLAILALISDDIIRKSAVDIFIVLVVSAAPPWQRLGLQEVASRRSSLPGKLAHTSPQP